MTRQLFPDNEFALQSIPRRQDLIPKLVRINDANEMHIVRLTGALTRCLEFQDAQVETPQDRPFNERHILDVLKRYGLLDLKQDPFAEAERSLIDLAIQLLKVMTCPPLPHPKEPDQGKGDADDGGDHRCADAKNKVWPNQSVELGDVRSVHTIKLQPTAHTLPGTRDAGKGCREAELPGKGAGCVTVGSSV